MITSAPLHTMKRMRAFKRTFIRYVIYPFNILFPFFLSREGEEKKEKTLISREK